MKDIKSYKNLARLTGLGYLIIFISGIYANFFVLESLVIPEDATLTMKNISDNEMLFRVGFLSFSIMVIVDVLLAWTLYILLKPVSKSLSVLAAWLRLVNGTIFGVALFNLLGVLELMSGKTYLNAFNHEQISANILMHFDNFNNTWLLGLVFFGLHLMVLGYLVYKSGYLPKFIGVLLALAALGYLIDSFAQFLMPNYGNYASVFEMVVVIPGVIGELSFTLWLLFKGINTKLFNAKFAG